MDYTIQLDEDFDLKVGAHTIKVRIVNSDNDGLMATDAHGLYIAAKYMILLDAQDPYSIRLSTLIHELIHVFEHFYEISMKHQDVNLVGDILAQILLDNFVVEKTPIQKRKKR